MSTNTNNMRTIHIAKQDIQSDFVTPPECGGQIVTFSYACTEDMILEKRRDDSKGGVETIVAYEWPMKSKEFSPQNHKPVRGVIIGNVVIV